MQETINTELDVPMEKKGVGGVTGPSPESGSLLYLPPCACGSALIAVVSRPLGGAGVTVWEVVWEERISVQP